MTGASAVRFEGIWQGFAGNWQSTPRFLRVIGNRGLRKHDEMRGFRTFCPLIKILKNLLMRRGAPA